MRRASAFSHANVGKATPRGRCRDDPAARPRALSVRPEPRGHRRGLAARQRDRVLAAGSDGHLAARGRRTLERISGRVSDSGEGRWTIRRPSIQARRPKCSRPRSTRASAPAARPTSRTSCSRRCATSSADITRSRPSNPRRSVGRSPSGSPREPPEPLPRICIALSLQ